MSLTVALNNALTGLNVNQRALAILSQNIANANTEGYSRQIVEQEAVYLDNQGAGVRVADILRKVDSYLLKSSQRQTGEVGYNNAINDFMDRLQVRLGEPGAENSLDEYTANFFAAIQSLAETPERVSFRESAVDAAESLARELSTLAEDLQGLRLQADQDIVASVRIINQQLRNLDNLNHSIANAVALGQPTAGLLDEQDMALKTLSEMMNIQTTTQSNGEIHVYAGNGSSILDENLYQLTYRAVGDLSILTDDNTLNPLQIQAYNDRGQPVGDPVDMISGGASEDVTTILKAGKLKALKDIRDGTIPSILEQLDQFAAVLRDQMNAIHNDGSAFPGPNSLTGTRLVSSTDRSDWSGNVMIGVLDGDGNPITSFYSDEAYTGVRPLNLDLSFLDSGYGAGQPTVQTIIDEINNHFYPPPVKAEVNNFNNIQLVSNTNTLPQSPVPMLFSFDFDIDNISAEDGDFYVAGVQVLDSGGVDITNVSTSRPVVNLDAANTYNTTLGSNQVVINAANHGLSIGDVVYLSDPGAAVGGISNASLTGYFEVTAATNGTFTIEANTNATAAASVGVANMTATPPWDTVEAGEKTRIRDAGTITADLSANVGSAYYDIIVNVGVRAEGDNAGEVTQSQITYRIYNNETNLLNDRYNNTALTGSGERVVGQSSVAYARAVMVDENGNELPKSNGVYTGQDGYLKIIAGEAGHTVAINELNSSQLGLINNVTQPERGTNRHFSHYFELNNLFKSNEPTVTGDTVKGSAINFAIEDRFLDNANLISLGKLVQSNQSADPDDPPQYTYERYSGDNSTIQALAKLGIQSFTFASAGGLDDTTITFDGYVGEILGYQSSKSVQAEAKLTDSQILLEGFEERLDNMKGVNVDEEMANTIIYQNAYQASARIITVTSELFDALLQSV